MKHPTRSAKSGRLSIVSSCSPDEILGGHESSLQTVHIHNTSVQPAKTGYISIVFVPLVSIGVLNASGITLPLLKTIFQHLAEFSWLKG